MNKALEKLYKEHRQGLYTYALSLTHSPQMAEDAIQTGFLGVLKRDCGRKDLAKYDNLVAYVFRSVRNAAVDLGRSSMRQRDLSELLFRTLEPKIGIDPGEVCLMNERNEILRQAIDKLEPKDRETVVLKLFAGLTFEQAGETIATSPKTVATRYRRALDKLQNQLKGKL